MFTGSYFRFMCHRSDNLRVCHETASKHVLSPPIWRQKYSAAHCCWDKQACFSRNPSVVVCRRSDWKMHASFLSDNTEPGLSCVYTNAFLFYFTSTWSHLNLCTLDLWCDTLDIPAHHFPRHTINSQRIGSLCRANPSYSTCLDKPARSTLDSFNGNSRHSQNGLFIISGDWCQDITLYVTPVMAFDELYVRILVLSHVNLHQDLRST